MATLACSPDPHAREPSLKITAIRAFQVGLPLQEGR